jgi:hypothetical protein
MDLSGLVLASLIIPIVIAFLSLLVFYLVIRLAVAHGLRDHHLWQERHRPRATRGWSLEG